MAGVDDRAVDLSFGLKFHRRLKLRSQIERSAQADLGFLHQLQQAALNAAAAHIPSQHIRWRGDLVDFVEVDDAVFRQLDVAIRLMDQFAHEIFHVAADVSGFGELGGVGLDERHPDQDRRWSGPDRFSRHRSGRA